MNDARRKIIREAISKLQDARALLEQAKDEEQEYFDNMPESFQSGEKGQNAENTVAVLGEAIEGIETAEGIAEGECE